MPRRRAPLLSDLHAAIVWTALLAGFSLGVAVCRVPRDRPTVPAAPPGPLMEAGHERPTGPPEPPQESLFRAHALEIVVGLAIGAVALGVTVFLFTRPS